MKVKEESEKVGFNLNIQKTKIKASGPITSWEIDGETVETVSDFILLGSKITAGGDCSHKIKRHLILGRNPLHGNSPGKNTRLGLLCPPPGDLHNPGIGLRSPALQVDSLPSEPPWKPVTNLNITLKRRRITLPTKVCVVKALVFLCI